MNIKRLFVVAALVAAMLASFAQATGSGDVTIRMNNAIIHSGEIMVGCDNNYLEIWIKNDAPLYELSLSFQITCLVGPVQFVTPFGTKPAINPVLEEMPAAQGYFDLTGGIAVTPSGLPNQLSLGGLALNAPLPASTSLRLCYRLRINAIGLTPNPSGFCVDNVVHPIIGEWSFDDGTAYPPTYNGNASLSITQPTAPQLCWGVAHFTCGGPEYTSVPPARVTVSHCDSYQFDFDGFHDIQPPPQVYFEASVGTMNFNTGEYMLDPQPGVDSVMVTAYLYSQCDCSGVEYSFVVVYTNASPDIAQCKPELRVKSGTSRTVDFNATDPDQCEAPTWSLELLSTPGPESSVSLDPQTGEISVDAVAGDLDELYDYRLITADEHGLTDSCEFQLAVIDCLSGDADGNGIHSISDVVYLISYIFGSPIPPDCEQSLDADCNGIVSISDAVFLVNYIFMGGPAPC